MRRLIALVIALASLLALGAAVPAAAQDEEPTFASGRIRERGTGPDGGDTLFAGVEVTITQPDGTAIGTGVTGDDGVWTVELPGGGDYIGTLDPSTLPAGVTLRNDANVREFSVDETTTATLLFPLGERVTSASSADNIAFLQNLVDGIKFGLIIGMSAIGLSLIYGTTGLVNFAHGEMVTFGAMMGFLFNVTGVFGLRFHLIIAGVLAMIVTGLAAGLLNQWVWRPLRRRGSSLISALVVSIGLSILFRYVMLYQFGGRSDVYRDYTIQKAIDFGPFAMVPKDIAVVVLSVVVLLGVGFAIQHTRVGKAMRAVSDNRDLAESSGIDVERVIRTIWVAGGALAGLGGVLFGLTEDIGWEMGFRVLLLMFAGVTLGGLGSAYGALIGSLVVGVFIQVAPLAPGDFITADQKNVAALVTLILILLVRPQGILGRAERVG